MLYLIGGESKLKGIREQGHRISLSGRDQKVKEGARGGKGMKTCDVRHRLHAGMETQGAADMD